MGGHPSAPVVPALIALAEERGSSGAELLQAYIVGFEVETHLARAVMPDHYEKGWHPTATLGVFGAAAACGRLLSLNVERLATALCIGASLAGGHRANFGTPVKPLHVGQAARNGRLAALVAEGGLDANLGAFEHAQGFFLLFNDGDGKREKNVEKAFDGWGDRFEILDPGISIKQHPCCGSAHSAIDAAVKLYKAHGPFDPRSVAGIDVVAHRRRLAHTDRPKPQSGLDAKFSVQFLTSKALHRGGIRLNDFADEAFMTPALETLMERVVVTAHEGADDFLAEVKVTMTDGSVREAAASTRLGRGPEDPLSDGQFGAKFMDCAGGLLGRAAARETLESLLRLEELPDIARLTARLVPDA